MAVVRKSAAPESFGANNRPLSISTVELLGQTPEEAAAQLARNPILGLRYADPAIMGYIQDWLRRNADNPPAVEFSVISNDSVVCSLGTFENVPETEQDRVKYLDYNPLPRRRRK